MSAPVKTRIAICTPCYDGRAHMAYFRGITDIRRVFSKAGIETAHIDAGSCANLPRLRNSLAGKALDWGAGAILWIDSDIMASGADAMRLWKSGKQIIGAAPQRRPLTLKQPPEVAFTPLPGGELRLDNGLIEVGGVATAFCLTHASVYRELRDSGVAKKLANRDGENSEWFCNYFWYELVETPDGYLDDGEDLYFCRKARELGFKCYIEPNVRPIHHEGSLQLPMNFWDLHGKQFEAAMAAE